MSSDKVSWISLWTGMSRRSPSLKMPTRLDLEGDFEIHGGWPVLKEGSRAEALSTAARISTERPDALLIENCSKGSERDRP
mmetsp:Transcript_32926/g.129249  ORF Transcript_32926/g.129249 Transcript_32926/m.129249 type:complete len:81 (-) Transcript_32926:478-720(-)